MSSAADEKAKEDRELHMKRMQMHSGPRGMSFSDDKASDAKGTLVRLLAYLKPLLIPIVIVFVITALSSYLNTYTPTVLQKVMEVIETGVRDGTAIDMHEVKHFLVILGVIYALSVIFQLVQQLLMIKVSQTLVYNFRAEIEDKLNLLPIKFFDTHSRGDILSRVSNDVENISNSLQQILNQVVSAIITIVCVLYFMIRISLILTLVSLLVISSCFLMTKIIAKKAKGYYTEQWASTGDLNGHIEEMFTGHTLVKAYNQQKNALEKFDKENERLYVSSFKAQFISGIMQPAMTVLNNLNYVIICVVGGWQAVNGTMTIGAITALISYSKQLMMPITQTAQIASTIQSTLASAERVFSLLDEQEVPSDEANAADAMVQPENADVVLAAGESPVHQLTDPRVITFEHVNFSYKTDTPLIEDLNITVRPGEKVAIVGPTGAGKTTLVNLLMRFYEVNGGRICIDGVDIRRIPLENLRAHIGMVLQDVWLNAVSIRENIAYGFNEALTGREATEEEIIQAAKMAYVDHFVQTLPEGYDTVINDEASNISQGQKQLITIARAFLSNPSILILDEATSSVDTRTEVLIQNAMNKLMEGRTNFIIAHRLSTIRDADTILVMNNGSIIEQGSHEELLAAKGFYFDLYNSQFIGAAVEEEETTASSDSGFGGFPGGFPSGGFPSGGSFPSGGFPGGFPGKGKSGKGKFPDFGKKNGDVPEGFDPANLPEGFDPSNGPPAGFDPSQLPEGFDPSSGPPAGFDPSQLPQGGPSGTDKSKYISRS